jgi:superfamily II DNA/RNA helicase
MNGRYRPTGSSIRMNSLTSESRDFIFAGMKLSPPLSTSLQRLGVKSPSPIQGAAMPSLASGLSCIIHAETGSGKV